MKGLNTMNIETKQLFESNDIRATACGLSAEWSVEAYHVAGDLYPEGNSAGLFIIDAETDRDDAWQLVIRRDVSIDRDEVRWDDETIMTAPTLAEIVHMTGVYLRETTTDESLALRDGAAEPMHALGCGCLFCTGGRHNDAADYYRAI
jgi:hypothetical protein